MMKKYFWHYVSFALLVLVGAWSIACTAGAITYMYRITDGENVLVTGVQSAYMWERYFSPPTLLSSIPVRFVPESLTTDAVLATRVSIEKLPSIIPEKEFGLLTTRIGESAHFEFKSKDGRVLALTVKPTLKTGIAALI